MTDHEPNPARLPVRAEPLPNGAGRRPAAQTEEMMPVFEQMVVDGFTNREIAERLGVSLRTITEWRKKVTREPRRNSTGHIVGTENAKLTADCVRLFSAGLTYLQIAEEVGVSYETVRSRLGKAYATYMEAQRDTVAGRQYADLQVLKAELLEIIIRDHMEDLQALDTDIGVAEDEQDWRSLIEKAFNKGRKNVDTKLAAVDRYLKVLDREAKLFGIDQVGTMNVNVNHKVAPETIVLLQRIEQIHQPDVVDAEVVDDTLELGSM